MVTEESGRVFTAVLEQIENAIPGLTSSSQAVGANPAIIEFSVAPRLAQAAADAAVLYRHLDLSQHESLSSCDQALAEADAVKVAAVVLSDFADVGLGPIGTLLLLRKLAQRWDAPVVVVAANAGSRAAVMSLLSGAPGFHTPPGGPTFELQSGVSSTLLASWLAQSGILPFDRRGIERDHIGVEGAVANDFFRATSIGQFLATVRPDLALEGPLSHFVWVCGIMPPAEPSAADHNPKPFLTVVVRTQGRRIQSFREALLCLAAQSSDDFEVIILTHQASADDQRAIEEAVRTAPSGLASRTRIVPIASGSRASLLNAGFLVGRGRYFAVLDDDDLVMAHWVESFRDVEKLAAGRVLRLQCAVQEAERVTVNGRLAVRARSELSAPYEREFSYSTHLLRNNTPFMSAAFPRELFHRFGLRFDETMTTTEDWDFLMRAVSIVGIEELPHFTAVYRQWPLEPTSGTAHRQQTWRLNQYSVDRKLDSRPILFPAGETQVIRELVKMKSENSEAARAFIPSLVDHEPIEHLQILLQMLMSSSWRVTLPIRLLELVLGRGRPIRLAEVLALPVGALRDAREQVEKSRSWRISAPLRELRRGH